MNTFVLFVLLAQADFSWAPEECRPPNVEPAFVSDCSKRLNLKKLSAKYQEAKAAADAEEEATAKACGADYLKLRVGMTWKRAKQCGGAYRQVGEDTSGRTYRFNGVTVRVASGKLTSVLIP